MLEPTNHSAELIQEGKYYRFYGDGNSIISEAYCLVLEVNASQISCVTYNDTRFTLDRDMLGAKYGLVPVEFEKVMRLTLEEGGRTNTCAFLPYKDKEDAKERIVRVHDKFDGTVYYGYVDRVTVDTVRVQTISNAEIIVDAHALISGYIVLDLIEPHVQHQIKVK